MAKGDKIVVFSKIQEQQLFFYEILNNKMTPDQEHLIGELPQRNLFTKLKIILFDENDLNLVDWFTSICKTEEERDEVYVQRILGKMIFQEKKL